MLCILEHKTVFWCPSLHNCSRLNCISLDYIWKICERSFSVPPSIFGHSQIVGRLRAPTVVPNDIPTPTYKSSFISEPVDIRFHELKCPGKGIFKATIRGTRNKILPELVALKWKFINCIVNCRCHYNRAFNVAFHNHDLKPHCLSSTTGQSLKVFEWRCMEEH